MMTKQQPWRLRLAAAMLTATVASSAFAADVYRREEPVSMKDEPYAAPPIAWGGFYIGANLGGVFADDFFANGRRAFDNDGQIAGGLHLGYNLQKPTGFVLGLEGDLNFADDIDYLSTVRLRAGFAVDNVLFYGTGGVAFAGFNDRIFKDDTETGYVVGGGIEGKVSQNMSLGLESLYHDFEDVGIKGGGDADVDFWSVRARATFHTN
jgi:outer membrane immunogenic protein